MKKTGIVLAALACLAAATPSIANAGDWGYRGRWHHRYHGPNGRVPGDVMAPNPRIRNNVGDVMAPDRSRRPVGGDVMAPSR